MDESENNEETTFQRFDVLSMVKNAKEAPKLTELLLSGKDIEALENVEPFLNVISVDLSQNKALKTIDALLDISSMLQSIDLSDCQLAFDSSEIEESILAPISKMTSLESLKIQGNPMTLNDFDLLLKYLPEINDTLRYLDIDNYTPSLEEENEINLDDEKKEKFDENFRMHLLHYLPNLIEVNGSEVGEEERYAAAKWVDPRVLEAQRLAEIAAAEAFELEKKTNPNWWRNNDSALEQLKKMMKKLKRYIKDRRILLKPEFLDSDPRRECCVEVNQFVQILDSYNLIEATESTDLRKFSYDHRHSIEVEDNLQLLLTVYRKDAPQRSKLGRDPSYQDKHYIDYIEFCSDLEPHPFGGRDMHERERQMDKRWKEKAPEISECLRRLRQTCSQILAKRKREEELYWKQQASMSRSAVADSNSSKLPYEKDDFIVSHKDISNPKKWGKLNAWEMIEFKKLLDNYAREESNGDGNLISHHNFIVTLLEMENYGRKVSPSQLNDKLVKKEVQDEDTGEVSITYSISGGVIADIINSIDADNSGYFEWKIFFQNIHEAYNTKLSPDAPLTSDTKRIKLYSSLQWEKILGKEALKKSKILYKKAKKLQTTLSLGGFEEEEATRLESELQRVANLATRMEAQASLTRQGTDDYKKRDIIKKTLPALPNYGRTDFARFADYKPPQKNKGNADMIKYSSCEEEKTISVLEKKLGFKKEMKKSYELLQDVKQRKMYSFPRSDKLI